MSSQMAADIVARSRPHSKADAVLLPSGVLLVRGPIPHPGKRQTAQLRLFTEEDQKPALNQSPSLEQRHLQVIRDQQCRQGRHMRHAVKSVCVNCGLVLHEEEGAR